MSFTPSVRTAPSPQVHAPILTGVATRRRQLLEHQGQQGHGTTDTSDIPVIPVKGFQEIPINTGYTCAHAMMDTGCTALLAMSAVLALMTAATIAANNASVRKQLLEPPPPPQPCTIPREHRPFPIHQSVPVHVRTIEDMIRDPQDF